VPVCASCGHANSEDAKFCEECGFAFAVVLAATKEQRRTVTVLFCDVTGSTALGESVDPERLRALLARYFGRMKGIVESHGGSVEKFIGDAVMAVFGVPVVHEDDALRACRAAVEMREALPELGIEGRIGVRTGEVVTGTQERLATGDAVNVAARLEQAAGPGEVLMGQATLALVGDGVEVEPLEPLELKGKAQPVPAHRLVAVHEVPEREHLHRFVGRAREVELLARAWQCALAEERCERVTVIGDAGVGKSRLTAEFVSGIDAPVVRGRCLSYGEGITYWPVIEVLKQFEALPSDPDAAAALRSLLGESDAGTSADEIAWAFRKLLGERAPVVCIFDDMQWGEETFLDLIEHVALLSSAPILLLCLGRPDFVERRPEWPVSFRLESLSDADVEALIPAALADGLRSRIARAAGGNPLFLTEMAAMAAQSGADVLVPPNLRALLAARLDQLDEPERAVLERGAIEGEIFHRGAVQALSDGGTVVPRLAGLVRKELIRPDRAHVHGDDGFRFRHLLIRDAAYDAVPKATRAELHERFAGWLEERGHLVELDEILGHHLEQAARYKVDLGRPDPELASRAGARLAAAGRRALWRSDLLAARELLSRALALTREIRLDITLELDLAWAYDGLGESRRSAELADAAAERAHAQGDTAAEAVAKMFAAYARLTIEPDPDHADVVALAEAAKRLLDLQEDHAGLVYVWYALATVARFRGQNQAAVEAATKAIEHARLAGQRQTGSFGLGQALVLGPAPADEAIAALDAALPGTTSPGPLSSRARLLAMLGRFEEAWAIAEDVARRSREYTGWPGAASAAFADIAVIEGDHERAVQHLRLLCQRLEEVGQRGFLASYGPALGRSLCAIGRYDEAEPLALLGRDLSDDDDTDSQMLWRQALAIVYVHQGNVVEADALVRKAIAIADRTDSLNGQADTRCDLAEVLAASGRVEEAVEALEQALKLYGRKKNLALVAQVRDRLAELRDAAPR
jgi:class 3 adenylate cyclase/tetratricopeptide (TPR) repeat protein